MKILLLTSLALLACSSMSTKIIYPGLTAFAKKPNEFEMPIEAAGLASMPEVRIDTTTAELFIAYRYTAGMAPTCRRNEPTSKCRKRGALY